MQMQMQMQRRMTVASIWPRIHQQGPAELFFLSLFRSESLDDRLITQDRLSRSNADLAARVV